MTALIYIELSEPGYTRRRHGKGWQYLKPEGKPVASQGLIARLNSLALPPAYRNAWYARDARSHIQATGIDARGRKQYRYHPDFRARQEEAKYSRCLDFAGALPKIRERVDTDLRRSDLSKARVVAAIVRILDLGQVRVGNAQYARENRSFGATTLRTRHARVSQGRVMLDYMGKSGKQQRIGIADKRLARLVKRCQDLPGQMLFQYLDGNGTRHAVTSEDVNDYLRENGSGAFTAKHFRTWGASVIAYAALAGAGGDLRLKAMLADVADKLGNTPAIARKSYVHPAIIEAALDPPSRDWRLPRATRWLSREERGLIAFLEERQV